MSAAKRRKSATGASTRSTGYQTTDGGAHWTAIEMGEAVNRIRIVPDGAGFVAYAIGVDVYKLDAARP